MNVKLLIYNYSVSWVIILLRLMQESGYLNSAGQCYINRAVAQLQVWLNCFVSGHVSSNHPIH